MKNVAKNEIVLHDPYSYALCPVASTTPVTLDNFATSVRIKMYPFRTIGSCWSPKDPQNRPSQALRDTLKNKKLWNFQSHTLKHFFRYFHFCLPLFVKEKDDPNPIIAFEHLINLFYRRTGRHFALL